MKKFLVLALATLEVSGSPGFCQIPDAVSSVGVNATLTKLFGKTTAFSARSEVRVLDKNQAEKMSASMDFALLDNKVRVETDMARLKSKDLSAVAVAGMKQLNLDRVISVVRPDKKAIYLVFPGAESYVTTPLSPEDAEAMQKAPRIEQTILGRETLDGHACVKHKVVLTDGRGEKTVATVWNAADLKDFPLQILTAENGDTVIMRFKQIQFARPAAKLFDVPAGYKGFADAPSLAQAAMVKRMVGGTP